MSPDCTERLWPTDQRVSAAGRVNSRIAGGRSLQNPRADVPRLAMFSDATDSAIWVCGEVKNPGGGLCRADGWTRLRESVTI